MARSLKPVLTDMRRAISRLQGIRGESDLTLPPFSDERAIVERFIEIISEASRLIPERDKAEFPDLPWRRIADIGNHIRHAYHRVDADLLGGILGNDIDPLDDALAKLLARLELSQNEPS